VSRASKVLWAVAVLMVVGLISSAVADPCGMVPPIYVTDNRSLVRVGEQATYVFYKDGIETFVIRPGFEGKVEDFGMLIAFPTPPALRKVSEDIFQQVAAAIDPPEVVVYAGMHYWGLAAGFGGGGPGAPLKQALADNLALKRDEVRVVREEAVGMYQAVVLEAGSAAALKRWMDDNGYKYPPGMDDVCEEYIKLGWCFVAEKAKVGGKANVDPKPRMKGVDTKLPSGSTFDGHVQAMAFRFKTDRLVLPMRLSAYNEGELHNIVYLLTDSPRKIRSIPEEYVVRQVAGQDLFRNVTEPLPLRIIGGTVADIPEWRRGNLPQERDPAPHNGFAKELFASDLLAVKAGRLSHPFEEDEKMLLRIGEDLGLRGPEIDKENLAALDKEREHAVKEALADVKKMTMTVIDGDFPREVVGAQNLVFSEYRMPTRRNHPTFYEARSKQPGAKVEGVLHRGPLPEGSPKSKQSGGALPLPTVIWGVFAAMLIGAAWYHRRRTAAR